ncbi:MAG: NADH-quinone oxidoreductase subunit C, partial [Candidatus Bathyarchaeota archaeon]
MERKEEITERLKMLLRENLIELKIPRERRVFLQIKKDALRETIDYLVNVLKIRYLSTITGVDLESEIRVIYHFSYENSVIISLSITVSKENPVASTITGFVPGAVLYEREVHDLLGVRFEGHPDLSPLILP